MGVIITSMRPKQWTKNLVVFAGLIFSRNIFTWSMQWKVWATFAAFCAVVGAGYLLNDILDREKDRVHPIKKSRPIASGRLGIGKAGLVAVILVIVTIAAAYFVDPYLPVFLAAYLVLQVAYALVLKHLVIIDVLVISAGFVLRATAGAVVIHVSISPWLLICAMLLALFLALAKRRAELVLLEDEASSHRRNLEHYSIALVDQMTGVTASATLVSYALYTFTAFDQSRGMMITIPFVLYGIFRYLYLVHKHLKGGSPEQILLTDKPLLTDILLWAGSAAAILQWLEK
ncbi:MAG: decaprenyl-phosphate phosphoribosyltransferase [Thermoleophilia bacterium]